MRIVNSLGVVLCLLVSWTHLSAQSCINVSTGYDEDDGLVIDAGVEDDDYTVDMLDGSLGGPLAFVVEEDGFPVPPWFANSDTSKWIGFNVPDSNNSPGTYLYEIRIDLPAAIDASKAVLIGEWGTDDGGPGVHINETFVPTASAGFGALATFPTGTGLGLFVTGENILRFEVQNGGEAANPTGLRVDACVGVPVVIDRPFDLSTGFDEASKILIANGAPDDDYRVTGPNGSGINDVAATAAPEPLPIPTWLVNSINSRWVGLAAADSSGIPGTYRYRVSVVLPVTFEAARGILSGGVSADDTIDDVLVNGLSTGFTAADPTKLTLFPVDAGQGLFRTGANSIEFVVSNFEAGSTGLRVDAEVLLGPEIPEPAVTVFSLDTGRDDATGLTIENGLLDDNFVVRGPPGSGVGPALAAIVTDTVFPIPPWVPTTDLSKWIGPQADSNGPAGIYAYAVTVNVPAGVDPEEARLVGRWATDDSGVDILINDTSTGIGNNGGFAGYTAFPPDAGKGLFQAGDNVVTFLVSNGGGPTGLRVEAVVGVEDPRIGDLSTGIGLRGIGPLPGGLPDDRYIVTGPVGSGIGPRSAIATPEDGSPIPPWAANSNASQWVGLDAADSAGPAGVYSYEIRFTLPPEVNPGRAVLAGSWAAAQSGLDILLNGESLGVSAPGPGALNPLPARAGLGFFVPGENTLMFLVRNDVTGPTGLRVEAEIEVSVEPNPLDISTGFDQDAGTAIVEGDPDFDYVFTDVNSVTDQAQVVLGAPIPPWLRNTESSGWIGSITSGSNVPPGTYTFEMSINIATDEEAAAAHLVGVWAVDDQGVDIIVNGTSTGITNSTGFVVFSPLPPDAGLGLFQQGLNTIEFVIVNGGTADNPMGLRVDAVVDTGGTTGPEERFVRGDANADGVINLTDAVTVLGYLFLGSAAPPCLDAADADDSGTNQPTLTDAVRILGWLFLGGLEPPPPTPSSPSYAPGDCGVDPTPDDGITCDAFAPCP